MFYFPTFFMFFCFVSLEHVCFRCMKNSSSSLDKNLSSSFFFKKIKNKIYYYYFYVLLCMQALLNLVGCIKPELELRFIFFFLLVCIFCQVTFGTKNSSGGHVELEFKLGSEIKPKFEFEFIVFVLFWSTTSNELFSTLIVT
jgi:hypothetical protein